MSRFARCARWRYAPVLALAMLTAGLLALAAPVARAQQAAGVDPGRDCQTLRTCRFTRGGSYRGCLSSYTCRTCKLVRTRCRVGERRVCSEMVCSWGG